MQRTIPSRPSLISLLSRCVNAGAVSLVATTLLTNVTTAGGPEGTVNHWVGGGGFGQAVVPTGVWTFDLLSDEQRATGANCLNTAFNPFGDIIMNHGWQPSIESTLPPLIGELPLELMGFDTFDVGGGVLRFDADGTGVLLPGQISEAVSPVIDMQQMELSPLGWPELAFSGLSLPMPPDVMLICGVREVHGAQFGPWQEVFLPIQPGAHDYRAPFLEPIDLAADGLQFKIGVQNNGPDPVPGGPAVDGVKAEVKDAEARSWKFVPDITQGNTATCMASAFANCLSWWASNGYPELTSGDTQAEKNETLRKELKEKIYDKDLGDAGVTRHLRDKGVYRGQPAPKPEEGEEARPQLEHVRRSGANATWSWLKEQFEAGHDVVIRVQWYNEDGELVDPDIAHYMTVARVQDGDSGFADGEANGEGSEEGEGEDPPERKIRVANPWGDTTDEVTNANKDDVYDTLDVTVSESGRIRLDNDSIEDGAAGIDDADYLCVTDINVVRPVAAGDSIPSTLMYDAAHAGADGALTSYSYTAANGFDTPLAFVALHLEVPIDAVSAPPGWEWMPLPTLYPGASGCGNWFGSSGVAWFTETDPIAPGDARSGFEITVNANYPFVDFEGLAYFEANEDGAFLIAPAPAPIPGDIDGDGDVDFSDLVAVLSAWGPCPAGPCPADLDGDGMVSFGDLLIVLSNYSN